MTCPLLGFYAALNGKSATTFRDNLRVRGTTVKQFEKNDYFSMLHKLTEGLGLSEGGVKVLEGVGWKEQ
jgi:hypothetical protein